MYLHVGKPTHMHSQITGEIHLQSTVQHYPCPDIGSNNGIGQNAGELFGDVQRINNCNLYSRKHITSAKLEWSQ